MRISVSILCFLLTAFSAFSAGEGRGGDVENRADSSVSEHFAIYYRFDRTDFDKSYLTNAETVANLRKFLMNSPRIDSITIHAWASPEGTRRHNVWLSEERARTARKFLLSNSPDSLRINSGKVRISPQSENWIGLAKLVEERYHRHDRAKVLRILNDTSISDETRKWRLKRLDKGYTWNFLWRRYMPELRSATWICVWAEVIPELPRPVEPISCAVTAEKPLCPPPASVEDSPRSKPARTRQPKASASDLPSGTPVASVATNLLVPGLNFGADVPIGNHWSVGGDYYYPWIWPGKSNKNCFELLGWSLEGRYWFGRDRKPQDRLKGHSLGLYAAGGYYDFERNFKGLQGEFVSTGLDYTYALAVGKRRRINLEFTLAIGYIHSWNRTYMVPGEGWQLYPDEGTMMFDYVGPTKAAVSIIVPIFRKEGGR